MMKSAITLPILFALVGFATQCGTTQPVQVATNQGTPSPQAAAPRTQVLTKSTVPVGKSNYKVGNGRGWNQLQHISKEMFIEGMISGIVAALQRSSAMLDETEMTKVSWLMSGGQKNTLAEVIQQIDAFYADSANLNIPILEAYKYAFYKFEGASQEALNKAVSDLRGKYKE